jgi:hypothetical protein
MAKKPLPRHDIQLALSREELRRLIHLVSIASWVIGAHKTEEDPRAAPYDELEQKIYALAARHSFAGETGDPEQDLLDYVEDRQKYYPALYFDEGEARDFIDEYDDDTFWDELAYRLAERDAVQEAGGFERYAELSGMERVERAGRFEELYAGEFYENGLEHVRIVRPPASRHTLH